MKINHFIPALAAVLGLALASAPVTVKAQTTNAAPATTATTAPAPSTADKAGKKKKGDYTQIPKGATISAIDASSVTLTTAKGDLKLAIDASTGFAIGKKKDKATVADFAAGDAVTGSYATAADGTMTAHNIRKKAAKTAAAAPAAAPATSGTTAQ
jgi:hypothetical protein